MHYIIVALLRQVTSGFDYLSYKIIEKLARRAYIFMNNMLIFFRDINIMFIGYKYNYCNVLRFIPTDRDNIEIQMIHIYLVLL